MNKERLRQQLTEMVAYKFDMRDQQSAGKFPSFENNGIKRYNQPDPPYPYMLLNTFKIEVDDHVSMIMLLIDQELEQAKRELDGLK